MAIISWLRNLLRKKAIEKPAALAGQCEILFISQFQFNNLVYNPVQFAFFDLRKPGETQKTFPKAMPTEAHELLDLVQKSCPVFEYPVVLICESGELSTEKGLELAKLGYKNVAVLKGGTDSLTSTNPGYQ